MVVDNNDTGYFDLHVRITPKAAKNKIIGWHQDAVGNPVLKISVTTVPENGKANAAVIAYLAKEWGIPKTSIQVKKGETDRNKILSVPKDYQSQIPVK